MDRPAALQERVFTRLFEQARISQFNDIERLAYIDSLKVYRDMNNVIRTARDDSYAKGVAQGIAQGIATERIEIARRLKAQNIDAATITACTGLSEDEIASL